MLSLACTSDKRPILSQAVLCMTTVLNARRRYIIACVCLLIIAGGLRFYNLSGHELRLDEIRVALQSRGDISEVVHNTRHMNSSPLLYPLALWAVQKVGSSEFSVRVMPALGSVLTVGALLFLMPRAGVARTAAFLAALLAALSVAAIEHAQDAREYSLDALIAALMIAGLLRYLRDGSRGLLCAALIAGPLLQYGLALFGAAALVAAAVANTPPPRTYVRQERLAYHLRVWEWLRRRIGLLLPLSAFGAACAISWPLTARYQWEDGGHGGEHYLAKYYYQGGFDAAAMVEFAIGRTWDALIYHMPAVIAAAALVAFGGAVLIWAKRRRVDALALLALLAVGIALCAALLEAYPWGGVRQNLYLGPMVFLAAGGAFHSVAAEASALLRRAWVAPALGVAVGGAIAVGGSAAVYLSKDYLYKSDASMKQVISALAELEREGDGVYVSRREVAHMKFHKNEKPDNYFHGNISCWGPVSAACLHGMLDEMFRVFDKPLRIWLVNDKRISLPKEMAAYSQEVEVEEIPIEGWSALHVITGFEDVAADVRRKWFVDAPSDIIIAESTYDVHLHKGALYYVKRACDAADTDGRFFLNIYPEDAADLSTHQGRRRGYDIVNFDFHDYGARDADMCVMRRDLPGYLIKRMYTGQIVASEGLVWEAELPVNSEARFGMYDDVVSEEPVAAGAYGLHIQDEALYYAKRPCALADTEARFFLNIYPVDAADLAADRREYGYDIVNFEFRHNGARDADKCLMWRDLPDYSIAHIHTGQYVYPDGPVIWEADFPFSSKARLDVYDEVVSDAPVAAGDYDVYLQDGALYYAKRPCALADTDGRFFLNIYPVDAADLPFHRRQRGYYGVNFDFQDYGAAADGKCLIRRALPSYAIDRIHTGQYVYPDGPIVWEVEFPFRP